MSRNGTGTYTPPPTSFPAVAGTIIEAAKFNETITDIATALSASISSDGQTTTTQPIPFAAGVKSDTISERVVDTGVTIDGVLLKDSDVTADSMIVDVVSEKTTDAGVTIDGVLLKDSRLASAQVSHDDWINPSPAAEYVKTLSDIANGNAVSLFRFMKTSEIPAIRNHTSVYDASVDINTAISECVPKRAPIDIPFGRFLLQNSLLASISNANYRLALQGIAAAGVVFDCTDLDGPMLEIATTGAITQSGVASVRGITFRSAFGGGGSLANNCGILFSGDNSGYMQYCQFMDLVMQGPYAAFRNTKTAQFTAFGLENMCSWNLYENVKIFNYTHQVQIGWDFTTGSGTGNTWSNNKCKISNTGQIWKFAGTGHVVGDLLISTNHVSNAQDGVYIGPDTVYRQNISIVGNQFDGAIANPIAFNETGTVPYTDLHIVGNNWGGTSIPKIPPVLQSVVQLSDFCKIQRGVQKTVTGTGAKSTACFKVRILDFAAFTSEAGAAIVTITAHGAVGGVSQGNAIAQFAMRYASGTVNVNQIGTTTAFPAGLFAFTTSVSGLEVTMNVTYTPTLSGSRFDAHIEAVGIGVTVDNL